MNRPLTEAETREFFEYKRRKEAERRSLNPPMSQEEARLFAEWYTLKELARGFPVPCFCCDDPPRMVKGEELRVIWRDRIEAERRSPTTFQQWLARHRAEACL